MVGFEDCGDYGDGAGVSMPLSGISRRERANQIKSSTNSRRAGEFWLASKTEIDVPGAIDK